MGTSTRKTPGSLRLYRSEVLQLGVIVVAAMVGASFLAWSAQLMGMVEASRHDLLRHVFQDASRLELAVANISGEGSESSRDVVVSSRADLAARLDSLALSWPEEKDPIARTSAAADLVVEQAERVWLAKGHVVRSEAMSEFSGLAGRLQAAVASLDTILAQDLNRRLDTLAWHSVAMMGGLALLHVAMGSLFLARRIRRERQWADSVARLDKSIETIFDPSIGIGDIDPILGSHLVKTVAALEKEHTDLMIAERSERHHARFAQDLIEALEVDDTPEHVYGTVARAAQLRMDGSSFRLLVSDSSGSGLEEKVKLGEAICDAPLPHRCPAIRKGRVVAFSSGIGLARCPFLKDDATKAMCAPVASGGKAFAVSQLTWDDEVRRNQLEGDLVTLVGTLGTRLGVLRTLEATEAQAATDPLTGLANRRAMNKFLTEIDRQGRRYSVISCDLDNFKKLNDVHGHETGDKCLVAFARVLKEHSRSEDLACRPGGEEFLVILSNVGPDEARDVADRIREALVRASQHGGVPFTCSMGVAARPDHAATVEELLVVADRMLYQAKESGRDRVCSPGGARPGEGGEPPKDEDLPA